jgi:hypothetical protein
VSRENAHAKARRYLGEGRLIVVRVDADGIRATCRGSGAVYTVTWTPGEGWVCDCPALGPCAHLLALQAVTVRSKGTAWS